MGWIHIHIDHGPGHQSSTDFYRYFCKIKGMTLKDQVEDFADNVSNYMSCPVMEWKSIRKLPASIHEEKIENAFAAARSAEASLRLLKRTDILTVDPIVKKEAIRKRKHERMMRKIRAGYAKVKIS